LSIARDFGQAENDIVVDDITERLAGLKQLVASEITHYAGEIGVELVVES
jgi:hypothetical protein